MLTQRTELFAPSQHYQEAITAELKRMPKPVEGKPMTAEIRDHLEMMLHHAASQESFERAIHFLQYCTGFIGHAVLSATCTLEERNHYWTRIDRIRQSAADRHFSRTGK